MKYTILGLVVCSTSTTTIISMGLSLKQLINPSKQLITQAVQVTLAIEFIIIISRLGQEKQLLTDVILPWLPNSLLIYDIVEEVINEAAESHNLAHYTAYLEQAILEFSFNSPSSWENRHLGTEVGRGGSLVVVACQVYWIVVCVARSSIRYFIDFKTYLGVCLSI